MIYEVDGDGPPVVLLHGLPSSGALWRLVVRSLRTQFQCIVVDFPGLGGSPMLPDGSIAPERLARELDEVRRELGIASWHLAGHDAGATIAVHYSTLFAHRTRRLALLSPPVYGSFRPPWFFRLLRKPGLGELLAPLVIAVLWGWSLERSIGRGDTEMRAILNDFKRPFRGRGGARHFLRLVRWGAPSEILGRAQRVLPRVEAPTLILHGLEDSIIPRSFACRAADEIPSCRLEWIEAGHFVPLMAPDKVALLLTEFLGEAERLGDAEPNTPTPSVAAAH
ncbi:MAG: alpha/beta hydrolase [Acidobacteriota bacterium]